jgi:hypothetical protein
MRLRIEWEAAEYFGASSTANGYISAGQCIYTLAAKPAAGGSQLMFDSFLGNSYQPQIQVGGVVNGIVDLQSQGVGSFRYWRIVYPQNMPASNATGSAAPATNLVLQGAASLATLNTSPTIVLLPNRTTAVPEIPVLLNFMGAIQQIWVPVGTSIGNLLERFTTWKPAGLLASPNTYPLTLSRIVPDFSFGSSLVCVPAVFNYPIALFNPFTGITAANMVAQLATPLFGGDQVTLSFSPPPNT